MAEYVFIDESGDPGSDLSVGASTPYYAEIALHLTEEGLSNLVAHIINWKYVLGKYYEHDNLPGNRQISRYLNPLVEMNNRNELLCSCVYLLKANYTGPYLQPTSYGGKDPLRFRNFVHKKLLEYHFGNYPPQERQGIELIFDQYLMTIAEKRDLEDYLMGNWRLPHINSICHVDSLYTEPVQIASQLVGGVKDIIMGTANAQTRGLLGFIRMGNIENP